jgi:hypothetical protein
MFPICRADLRCWSTPDPGVDAAVAMDAYVDPGTDAYLAPGTDAYVAPRTDAYVNPGTDAYVTPGTDAYVNPGTDAWAPEPDAYVIPPPDAYVPPATDAGPLPDTGGPCGGGPLMTFYRDADGDGHGAAASGTMMRCSAGGGYVASSDDCDDANPGRFPGNPELCNNVDDDCNGTSDGSAANASCMLMNANAVCELGFCAVASCRPNFGDCDAMDANGCEVDTRADGRNCGGCGMPCLAADTCSASSCDDSPVVQIAGGSAMNCARRANGHVACWGVLGSTTYRVATELRGVTDAIDVDLSANLACVVHAGGTVSCLSDPALALVPVGGLTDAVDVAVGSGTACAIRTGGRIACWGARAGYPAGTPGTGDSPAAVPIAGFTDAVQLEGVYSLRGVAAFIVRRTSGAVNWWAGGEALSGPATPVTSAIDVTVGTSYTAGGPFYCAVLSGGDVRCWGGPAWGVAFSDAGPPVMTGIRELHAIPSTNWMGQGGLCGATTSGAVYCIGSDGFGQLGLGGPYDVRYTTQTLSASLGGVSAVTGYDKGGCALTMTGLVRCWGIDDAYQVGTGALGVGPGSTTRTPTIVSGL